MTLERDEGGLQELRLWVGRTCTADDMVTPVPARALAATLDRDTFAAAAGDLIPPCWHWLYFLPVVRRRDLGTDGHPRRGGFLPPVPLPRRMWAGSRMDFLAPVRIGQALHQVSRIADIQCKDGRTGRLVFVKVRHEISADGTLAIVDEHDIVYRDWPADGAVAPTYRGAPEGAAWTQRVVPDPVLLFRYSALTFNGHRIHYDQGYVTGTEGYPGLIVHGPLTATLLLELLHQHRPDARVRGFQFRALKPLFATAAFDVCGGPVDEKTIRLWTRDADGHQTMEATATLE